MVKILQFQKPPRKRGFGAVLAVSCVLTAICGAALAVFVPHEKAKEFAAGVANAASGVETSYRRCSGPARFHCVVDGDTFWRAGQKIRIADIDTPEVSEPKCAAERALGVRATNRLIELLNAGPYELHAWQDRDQDKYGRKLRVVMRGGRSIGDQLVSEGLARTWSGRREPWC
jgi:endonuclease YncB( thermonuclease family)